MEDDEKNGQEQQHVPPGISAKQHTCTAAV